MSRDQWVSKVGELVAGQALDGYAAEVAAPLQAQVDQQAAQIADLAAKLAAATGPTLPDGYSKVVLFDEFATLNSKVWSIRDNYAAGNEYAIRRAGNVSFGPNGLVIQPKRERSTAPTKAGPVTRDYTSGEIYTDGKLAWDCPWRCDIDAALPHLPDVSSTLWPAGWFRAGKGPGEIDGFEVWGTRNAMDSNASNNSQGRFSGHIFANTDTAAGQKGQWMIGAPYVPITQLQDLTKVHRYSTAVAEDGSVTYLFDDQVCATFASADFPYLNPKDPTYAFAGGYTLRLTLQIGQQKNGQPFWYGAPIDDALDLTQNFTVRRVLVSQP